MDGGFSREERGLFGIAGLLGKRAGMLRLGGSGDDFLLQGFRRGRSTNFGEEGCPPSPRKACLETMI